LVMIDEDGVEAEEVEILDGKEMILGVMNW
jgi:hypothetical protein